MTFYYYTELDGETEKNKVTINKENLEKIYKEKFDKESNKRFIKFLSPNEIYIRNTKDVIIENYHIEKKDRDYEISYTMYDYPKICQLIDGLLNENTFRDTYEKLKNMLVSTKKEQIEQLRRKIDMEIRVLNIMLDSNEYDYKLAFTKVRDYFRQVQDLCNYDSNLAHEAEIIAENISIEKVKEDIKVVKKHSLKKQKNLIKK